MARYSIFERVSLSLRAWWWLKKPKHVTQELMPADVRNFVLLRSMRLLEKGMRSAMSPERRLQMFEELCRPLFEANQWRKYGITEDTMGAIIKVGFKYLETVPLEYCTRCNAPVFTHKATKTDSGYLCEYCANEPSSD